MDILEFTQEELLGRVTLCQKKMAASNLKGMVITGDQNIAYYADFRSPCRWNTFTRPTFMFIPVYGTAILYTQSMFTPVAQERATYYVQRGFTSLEGPSVAELAAIMTELDMAEGNIGFELGSEQRLGMQVDVFLSLKEAMTKAHFVDASDIIWAQRCVKSEMEIACIRRACQATSYAFDRLYEQIREGMTERDITMMAQRYMLDGGAERPGFHIITAGEGGYNRICDTGRNRKIQNGDFLWLDMGAVYNGYWADFCRSGVVGEISENRNHLQTVVHEVTMEAAQMLRPGVNVKEVAQACVDGMHKRGVDANFDCGRMGHGIGLGSTELPSITLHDDFILEEGMVIALEPGICTEDGLYDIEEIFVVRKNGGECLSDSDRTLHSIKP